MPADPSHPGFRTVMVRSARDGATRSAVERFTNATADWVPLVRAGRSEVWTAPGSADTGPARGRWVVKIDRGEGLKAGLRVALGHGPRARAYAWGQALRSTGLVQAPIALLGGRLADGPRYQATVTLERAGPTLLEALGSDDGDTALAAARAAGAHAARLLAAGVWNRDHKPSNLMFDGPGALRLIDLDGLRRGAPPEAPARMLASLAIEPTGLGRPLPPELLGAIATGLAEGGSKSELLTEAERLITRHGDARPARDPAEAERRRRAGAPSGRGGGDTL